MRSAAQAASSAASSVRGMAANIASSMASAASRAAGSMAGMARSIAGSMASAARSVADATGRIRASIAGVQGKTVSINVGAGSVKLPHFSMSGSFDPKTGKVPSVSVSWYAKGGIFTQPAVIGVGEGREPEGVFPLSRLESMLGGDATRGRGDVTVNLSYTGSADPDELVRTLSREMRMLRLTGAI